MYDKNGEIWTYVVREFLWSLTQLNTVKTGIVVCNLINCTRWERIFEEFRFDFNLNIQFALYCIMLDLYVALK